MTQPQLLDQIIGSDQAPIGLLCTNCAEPADYLDPAGLTLLDVYRLCEIWLCATCAEG